MVDSGTVTFAGNFTFQKNKDDEPEPAILVFVDTLVVHFDFKALYATKKTFFGQKEIFYRRCHRSVERTSVDDKLVSLRISTHNVVISSSGPQKCLIMIRNMIHRNPSTFRQWTLDRLNNWIAAQKDGWDREGYSKFIVAAVDHTTGSRTIYTIKSNKKAEPITKNKYGQYAAGIKKKEILDYINPFFKLKNNMHPYDVKDIEEIADGAIKKAYQAQQSYELINDEFVGYIIRRNADDDGIIRIETSKPWYKFLCGIIERYFPCIKLTNRNHCSAHSCITNKDDNLSDSSDDYYCFAGVMEDES